MQTNQTLFKAEMKQINVFLNRENKSVLKSKSRGGKRKISLSTNIKEFT
jgi:hypothetical protein